MARKKNVSMADGRTKPPDMNGPSSNAQVSGTRIDGVPNKSHPKSKDSTNVKPFETVETCVVDVQDDRSKKDVSKKPDKNKIAKYEKYLTTFKTVNTSLKSLAVDEDVIADVNDFVCKVSKIDTHTYNFFKLYCLHHYYEHDSLPVINETLFESIMKTVTVKKNSNIGTPNKETKDLLNKLDDFYENHYKRTVREPKVSYEGLIEVFHAESKTMMTGITNHVRANFESSLYRYVNVLANYDELRKVKKASQIHAMLRKVKHDLFKGTNKANPEFDKYKTIFKDTVLKSFPVTTSLSDQLKADPLSLQILLIRMSIHMETILLKRQLPEDKGKHVKTINCFPLRKSIIPKSVPIDTMTVIGNFIKSDRTRYREDQTGLYKEIWSKIVDIRDPVFKKQGYKWSRAITTDGVTCGIRFIRKDLYKPGARNKTREVKKPYGYMEFKYIGSLEPDQIAKINFLAGKTYVGIDPGKDTLIYCTDGTFRIIRKPNGKYKRKANVFRYTNAQRKYETRVKFNRKRLEKIKSNKRDRKNLFWGESVKYWETVLSGLNASSCLWDNVMHYMRIKNLVNFVLYGFYERKIHRRNRWYQYINKQRADSNMIKRFRKKFGPPEKVVIFIGDWSEGKSMKYKEPSKGKSIRRLFKRYGYDVYLVPEFNTSQKLYETGEQLVNFRKYEDRTVSRKQKRRERIREEAEKAKAAEKAKTVKSTKPIKSTKTEPNKTEPKQVKSKKTKPNKKGKTGYVHRIIGSEFLKSNDDLKMNTASPFVRSMYESLRSHCTIMNRDLNGSLNIRWRAVSTILFGDENIPEYLKRPPKVSQSADEQKKLIEETSAILFDRAVLGTINKTVQKVEEDEPEMVRITTRGSMPKQKKYRITRA